MNVIELENRTAQEVFEELKARLEGMGYLPDEYFLLSEGWEDGRKMPSDANIFCTADYGSSEGINLEVYLKWYEDGKHITKGFIIGKTLGENGSDLDRMFLISSAITKAFRGDGGQYDRYMRLGEPDSTGGMTLHLNADEQRVFIDALIAQREKMLENTVQTEQLLRRMVGSITAYMDEVGQRPLRLSDFDKAMLAIRDGELAAFKEHYPKAIEQAEELLTAAASRPGTAGRKMTLTLLVDAENLSGDAYLAACKGAVDTGDMERLTALLEQADSHLAEPRPALYGETVCYAYSNRNSRYIARQLIQQGAHEQISAAPPLLIRYAVEDGRSHIIQTLADKGCPISPYACEVLHALFSYGMIRKAEELLQGDARIENDDYAALYACIKNDQVKAAKILLDRGMDFELYQKTASRFRWEEGSEEMKAALLEHWESKQSAQEQSDGPALGGISL